MSISSDQAIRLGAASSHPRQQQTRAPRYLYSPVIDFLCLGGGSFALLPVIFALPEKELATTFGAIFLGLSFFINYPHFAFSYQVFYEGFLGKAFGSDNDVTLRARYVFAGIVVPVSLAAFVAYSMIFSDAALLGYGANLMGLLVGWHYVKQGYGMLMVDAALKRQFFDDADKKILRINSYAVWVLAWLALNSMMSERTLWGIQYYMFHIPPLILEASACIAIATTATTVSALIKKWRANGGSLPVNGVAAYIVSLYLWLLLMHWNALWLLTVPALHSLQYLVVVTRYRANRLRDGVDMDAPPRSALLGRFFRHRHQQRYAGFILVGLVLGFLGFWGVPEFLQAVIPYDRAVFGTSAFLFVFWIFINVHHYFLDNVMWRSQNADVRKYLFA